MPVTLSNSGSPRAGLAPTQCWTPAPNVSSRAPPRCAGVAVEHHVAEGPCASQPSPRSSTIAAWKRRPRIDGSVWSNAGSYSSLRSAIGGGGGGRAPIYFFFGLTACFKDAPAENLGALDALILTRSPVRGLTP